MAGVTTDVCMVAPAISAVEEGFNMREVCDACGSGNQIAELVRNGASPVGAVAFPLLT